MLDAVVRKAKRDLKIKSIKEWEEKWYFIGMVFVELFINFRTWDWESSDWNIPRKSYHKILGESLKNLLVKLFANQKELNLKLARHLLKF